jgi:hypothetical protein
MIKKRHKIEKRIHWRFSNEKCLQIAADYKQICHLKEVGPMYTVSDVIIAEILDKLGVDRIRRRDRPDIVIKQDKPISKLDKQYYKIPLTNSKRVALVSACDYKRVKAYKWWLRSGSNGGEAIYTSYSDPGNWERNRIAMSMHRFILGDPKGKIHHINRRIEDNRRENLQVLTDKEHLLIHGKGRGTIRKQRNTFYFRIALSLGQDKTLANKKANEIRRVLQKHGYIPESVGPVPNQQPQISEHH